MFHNYVFYLLKMIKHFEKSVEFFPLCVIYKTQTLKNKNFCLYGFQFIQCFGN